MKQFIEIEADIPEGWKAVAYKRPISGEWFLNTMGEAEQANILFVSSRIILEKIKPRRRVFECVSETPREPTLGEFYEGSDGDLFYCEMASGYRAGKIWKEVFE